MNAPRRRAASRVSRLARAEAPVVRRAKPAGALTRTPAEAAVAVAAKRAARVASIPADLAEQFTTGKLSQRCPEPGCETVEAAGFYSTCHERKTGPADWFAPVASPGVRAAAAAGLASRRAKASRASESVKSAPPAVLASPAESLTLGF